MKMVPGQELFRWIAKTGIPFDKTDPGFLTLMPTRTFARFWVLPTDPTVWPFFIATLLAGLDNWAAGYLWPRSGCWPEYGKSQSNNEGVRDVVLRGAGVPSGFSGAIRFERDEENSLITILFVNMILGWCIDDDLFFIPDHARQLLQTDHHDVIHVECLSNERVQKLIDYMNGEGNPLPTELPDGTFKRPVWMGGVSDLNC